MKAAFGAFHKSLFGNFFQVKCDHSTLPFDPDERWRVMRRSDCCRPIFIGVSPGFPSICWSWFEECFVAICFVYICSVLIENLYERIVWMGSRASRARECVWPVLRSLHACLHFPFFFHVGMDQHWDLAGLEVFVLPVYRIIFRKYKTWERTRLNWFHSFLFDFQYFFVWI